MKSPKIALLYGFLIWVIVLAFAMLIYPVRVNNRVFFESLMSVALVACTTVCAALYFGRVTDHFLREGAMLGLIWFALNFGLDQLAFAWGPMQMSFADYVMDIGATYLLIPVIPLGLGYALARRSPAG